MAKFWDLKKIQNNKKKIQNKYRNGENYIFAAILLKGCILPVLGSFSSGGSVSNGAILSSFYVLHTMTNFQKVGFQPYFRFFNGGLYAIPAAQIN